MIKSEVQKNLKPLPPPPVKKWGTFGIKYRFFSNTYFSPIGQCFAYFEFSTLTVLFVHKFNMDALGTLAFYERRGVMMCLPK